MTPPGEIHQNPPHQLRRHAEKVRAILPLHLPDIHQLQVDLVDERRRLQRVIGTLCRHVTARYAVQLSVDHWKQLVECLLSPAPHANKSLVTSAGACVLIDASPVFTWSEYSTHRASSTPDPAVSKMFHGGLMLRHSVHALPVRTRTQMDEPRYAGLCGKTMC